MKMNFSKDELAMVYQYAAGTKEETLAGLKEIVPVIRDRQTREIVESTIRKLDAIPEPECRRFIADTKQRFIQKRDHSIRRRLAGQGAVVVNHFVQIKPAVQPQRIKKETDIVPAGCCGNRAGNLMRRKEIQKFHQSVRQFVIRALAAEGAVNRFLGFLFLVCFLLGKGAAKEILQGIACVAAVDPGLELFRCNAAAQFFRHVLLPCFLLECFVKKHGAVKIKNSVKHARLLSVWGSALAAAL